MFIPPDQTLIPSEASYLLRIAFIFARVTNIITVVFLESEQDRQCLFIATLRRVRLTIAAVEEH
jgi:hypothetical protein